jgi:O-acetyl-ADP-ribose deacetylase (regulator of RNase III)
MTLRVVQGDLFESELPAIGHGCNTSGAMGSGIAREFRRRYPVMYNEYRAECLAGRFLLGDVMPWWEDPLQPIVFNLGTQPRPGRCASIGAIRAAVKAMLELAEVPGRLPRRVTAIGIPQIGCGLGGLRWMNVRPVLDEVAADYRTDLVVHEL